VTDLREIDGSTLEGFLDDMVAETFEAENTRRQADRDPLGLSMSGLGGCTRRNAYSIAGTPASDTPEPEQARQALLGVGAHDWFLPALARAIEAKTGAVCVVEHPVSLTVAGITIAGTLDLAFDDVVIDLKTIREWKLGVIRRKGAYDEHRLQVFGYAYGRWQAGHPVRWVAYLYMDRSTGEVQVVVEEFTTAAAETVMRRVEDLNRLAGDPDTARRDGRGPGVSLICDRCPWLKRCWGPTAVPGTTGPQTILAASTPGLLEILALYVQAAAVAGSAERDKDFAKLVLSCTNPAQYGGYVLHRAGDGVMDDTVRMKAVLGELGIDIPKKLKAGAITVRPAKPDKKGK